MRLYDVFLSSSDSIAINSLKKKKNGSAYQLGEASLQHRE